MPHPILETVLVVLLTVLLVNIFFRPFRLPLTLGYLVVGVLVGPHVFALIPDTQAIASIAEFGVVLLMFTVGLEFSFPQLLTLKYSVFVLGVLQVIMSIMITVVVGLWLQMTITESIVIGCVVAMSSTALVVKLLSENFEIHAKHGLTAIGILLFQDLAVIPVLVTIASLSGLNGQSLSISLLSALLKGLIAIFVIIGLGRWLLRPLFHLIASTRIVELFTLSVLFVAIGSAWLTSVLGMTLALGAFLSGIMLGETQFRHQIKSEIRPFRDVLLGLFFVSIGMLANVTTWGDTWDWILLLLIALIVGKSLLIISLCWLVRYDIETAIRTGLILGQGGEFGFAILALALSTQLLPMDYGQVVLGALIISFALGPIIIRHNQRIATFFLPKSRQWDQEQIVTRIKEIADDLADHVIICGFGRVGQNVARFLNKMNIAYLGFDLDPTIIHNTTLAGEPSIYGNVTHPDVLKAAKPEKAAAVVISFDNIQASLSVLAHLQDLKIPILVRCKDEAEFELLRDQGATRIVTEVFEESLTLANYLLQILHVPKAKINMLLQEARENNYEILAQIFPGSILEEPFEENLIYEHLRPTFLPESAYAVAKTLGELKLPQVDVVTIRRDKDQIKPTPTIKLRAGDILILYGLPTNLDEAEKVLLVG
ncbi:monovalent cation-H antiporter-2, CPA2 family [Legionella lansingensis]|uniref:Glutathione-regulated potassium efflux system n=1 Tax=Legionella lansingensis TaxID=45067 RepID=A0A0W0VX71_9GAMM|nr:cation:proton antiporter [Legionella lansingensis]KTD24725.1 glutathione-regulated potassium efflux system [Legionella lansingensis]SNV53575.1 monovalent cation-H antiporter-2, CPA2 family [Legionella lansingensis]